jgi:hypothetical protein
VKARGSSKAGRSRVARKKQAPIVVAKHKGRSQVLD